MEKEKTLFEAQSSQPEAEFVYPVLVDSYQPLKSSRDLSRPGLDDVP